MPERRSLSPVLSVVGAIVLGAGKLQAGEACELAALDNGLPPFTDASGSETALSGNYSVGGATNYRERRSAVGALHIFKRNWMGCGQQVKRSGLQTGPEDGLGVCLDMGGDLVVATASSISTFQRFVGQAYVVTGDGEARAKKARLISSGSAEERHSDVLTITTGKRGDVVDPFHTAGGSEQPDCADIQQLAAKFTGNTPPAKVRTILRGDIVEVTAAVGFMDINAVVERLKQAAYTGKGVWACNDPCPA